MVKLIRMQGIRDIIRVIRLPTRREAHNINNERRHGKLNRIEKRENANGSQQLEAAERKRIYNKALNLTEVQKCMSFLLSRFTLFFESIFVSAACDFILNFFRIR